MPTFDSAALLPGLSLNNSIGAIFIGLIVSALRVLASLTVRILVTEYAYTCSLYGVTFVQGVQYYQKFTKDSIFLKLSVR